MMRDQTVVTGVAQSDQIFFNSKASDSPWSDVMYV